MAESGAIDTAEAIQDKAYLGGGSVPAQELSTWCIALEPVGGGVDALAAALRKGQPAVVGRVQQDRLLLDMRSVFPRQDTQLVEAIEALDG